MSRDWSSIVDAGGTEDQYRAFNDTIQELHEECFPLTKIKTNPLSESKPWISLSILKSIKKKNKMYKRYLISRSSELLESYKTYKNKLTTFIRLAEKEYFSGRLLQVKDNMSKTWAILNSMTNKNRSRVEKNGVEINNPKEIAEEFNNFFVNIGSELAKKVPLGMSKPLDFLNDIDYSESMFLAPTVTEEILDIISNLKNSSSSGVDNIPVKLIKLCKAELAPILAHINNQSLLDGIFPDSLKIAKVIPIFKSGNSDLVSNYRPISILSVFSKIFEKVMHSRLQKYIFDKAILHGSQFGFRSKLSTCMALLDLLDKLSSSIDNGEVTVGLFIDLAKAFDTVDHKILLNKLQHYGIRGIALKWFQSYLSNRKQCVTVNGQSSDFAIITCGVPQGSILGPTLFLLYINDLALVSKLFQIIMFADDTNLFVRGKSVEQIKNQINTELLIINEWFKTNRLSLNLDKTTYVIFGNKKFDDIKIYFRDVEIKRQFETKFLGVILQANLKWNTHINIVLSKTSKCLGIMSKIRHLIPQHLTRMLYLTLVEPYINYCNIVWCSPDKTSNLEKILRVQKKYCRLMTFASFSAPSKPLFLELKLLNVYEIYKYQLAVYMYKF